MNIDVRTLVTVVLILPISCATAVAAPAHLFAGAVVTARPAAVPKRPLPVSPETCGRGGVKGTCGAIERPEHTARSPSLPCEFKPGQCAALAAIRDEALALRRADGGSLSAAHRDALQLKIDVILSVSK